MPTCPRGALITRTRTVLKGGINVLGRYQGYRAPDSLPGFHNVTRYLPGVGAVRASQPSPRRRHGTRRDGDARILHNDIASRGSTSGPPCPASSQLPLGPRI